MKLHTLVRLPFVSKRNALVAFTLALIMFLIPVSAYAIFGAGIVVFDPTNFAEAVKELAQDVQMVNQAIQTYNLLKSELRMITSRPWQTIATDLASIAAQDLGNSPSPAAQDIAQAINGLADARAAWSNGTMSMPMDALNSALASTLKNSSAPAHLNAIQVTDALAIDALRTLGQYRTNQSVLTTAIQHLQTAQEATDDADNTPVAQQNITNGILLQLLKLQQSASSLHAVVTEQLAAANSWQRNTAADNLTMISNAIQSWNTAPADYSHTAGTLTNYLIQ
jgi:conjugal transfer/entry exclusion protein